MAGRKRERYKIEPRISVPFMLELEYESKVIKILVIKEICSWLPPGLDGRKVYDRPFFHVCNPVENLLFSTLIIGSFFNDCVVFYGVY